VPQDNGAAISEPRHSLGPGVLCAATSAPSTLLERVRMSWAEIQARSANFWNESTPASPSTEPLRPMRIPPRADALCTTRAIVVFPPAPTSQCKKLRIIGNLSQFANVIRRRRKPSESRGASSSGFNVGENWAICGHAQGQVEVTLAFFLACRK
jgi:hypothetical protein